MAGHQLTLYYFPTSYYSLKALLALQEKNIPFKGCVVNIHAGEHNAEWFAKINPMREVPALRDGSKVIVGSEEILDYLEAISPSDPPLKPDVNTPRGGQIQKFREQLQDIPIDQLSFGVFVNRSLCTGEFQGAAKLMTRFNRETVARMMSKNIAGLQEKLWATSEPQDALQEKLKKMQRRSEVMFDLEKVTAVLDDLNPFMDEMETLLRASKKDAGNGEDYWLFGTSFTLADVCAAIFFYRLEFVAIESRFYSPDKRPLLFEYKTRLRARPSVLHVIGISENVKWTYMRTFLKKAALTGAKVGVIAGGVVLGIVGYRYFAKS